MIKHIYIYIYIYVPPEDAMPLMSGMESRIQDILKQGFWAECLSGWSDWANLSRSFGAGVDRCTALAWPNIIIIVIDDNDSHYYLYHYYYKYPYYYCTALAWPNNLPGCERCQLQSWEILLFIIITITYLSTTIIISSISTSIIIAISIIIETWLASLGLAADCGPRGGKTVPRYIHMYIYIYIYMHTYICIYV